MAVFDAPDFDDHEQVSFFRDPASGLRAIVAIHSTAPYGISGGGCRMWPYEDDAAALKDALRLSRAMSYKLALCGMPAGGAKSVIIGDARKDKTEALLRAMGRFVERLGGKYIIAEDVGTTEDDMNVIGKETRYVVGKKTDTGPPTAYGAFVGIRAGVERTLGRKSLSGLRFAIQGVGGVGRRLAALLKREGAQIVVADVSSEAVARVVAETEAHAVEPDRILEQRVDVLVPCALGGVLNDASIPKLACRLIAGAANNQLAEERHADAIAARGIVYLPDFILNAGGVIGASQEGTELGGGAVAADYDEGRAFKETGKIADLVVAAIERAERESTTPYAAAVRMAKETIQQLRQSA